MCVRMLERDEPIRLQGSVQFRRRKEGKVKSVVFDELFSRWNNVMINSINICLTFSFT